MTNSIPDSPPIESPGLDLLKNEIVSLEREWADCLMRGDLTRLDQLQTPGFTLITHNGDIVPKIQLHEILRSQKLQFFEIKILDLDVQMFGSSALVIGKWQMSTKFFEAFFNGKSVFNSMWVKLDGVWRSTCVHTSDARLIESWKSVSARPL